MLNNMQLYLVLNCMVILN